MVEQASSQASSGTAGSRSAPVASLSGRWRRLLPGGIALLWLLYCGLWNLAARLPLNRTDLDAFFVPASASRSQATHSLSIPCAI